jgi:hypothetical protein
MRLVGNREATWRYRGYPAPTRPMPEACEICGKPELQNSRGVCLDHDHETNKFRGWLCTGCNVWLGRLGDTQEGVEKWFNSAMAYFRRAGN